MSDADERLRRAMTFRIQKYSTDDGPGIRTTIFFKGCPMACRWCQNPEGISYRPELFYVPERCIVCGDCVEACPNKALSLRDTHVAIDRRLCQTCGTCALGCPTGALEVVGRPYTVDNLFELIQQEQTFYEHSGGGVTFSGGEAASHHSFLRLLANRCKDAHIHTALDTCLIHEWPLYRSLLSHIDLWIVQLKLMDARHYEKGTGQGIWSILENARQLNVSKARVWVKTPIVPGWTDTETNIRAIGDFIRHQMPRVERWELTSLANLRTERSRALGQVFEIDDAPPLRAERLNELAGLARSICQRKIPVVVAGPASIG